MVHIWESEDPEGSSLLLSYGLWAGIQVIRLGSKGIFCWVIYPHAGNGLGLDEEWTEVQTLFHLLISYPEPTLRSIC